MSKILFTFMHFHHIFYKLQHFELHILHIRVFYILYKFCLFY
ncbi:hypothetical protein AAJ76_2850002256 [Vairimorpha ceranae]|uniref:Uncharacterized protein n=1 Tax=Vairimorpha ceranae TaxID=40302 RepID=A0A0F9W7D0_9MICR|nr:hypothetical protein AAJ76_2850002256 [Vairimorpha ceranae]KKO73711.1 hypothetical protein AAJ76_2850002256 [Vairimorpha ceranae]